MRATIRLGDPSDCRRRLAFGDFGYPVSIDFEDFAEGKPYRLLLDKEPVPAQFGRVATGGGKSTATLDFNASPGPNETQRFTIVATSEGGDSRPGGGMRLAELQGGRLGVIHSPGLEFLLRSDLVGFLESVGPNTGPGYLRGGSRGLTLQTRDGRDLSFGPGGDLSVASRTTLREGPLTIGLRFDVRSESLPDLASRILLTFPRSKSWIEAVWDVNDPSDRVKSLDLGLNLRLGEGKTLVDFGAAGTVYGVLEPTEHIEMIAGPSGPADWVIRKGAGDDPAPFAAAAVGSSIPVEGWAHIMDAANCTALAVDQFGRSASDLIRIDEDGRVATRRSWASDGAAGHPTVAKRLHFWLHFVPMPVQVGAATSPQAMLAPLSVAWDA